jgi:hypothetical protein
MSQTYSYTWHARPERCDVSCSEYMARIVCGECQQYPLKVIPGTGQLFALLFTNAQVEPGTDPRLEMIGLLEMRAGERVVTGFHGVATSSEELFGRVPIVRTRVCGMLQ